MKNALLCCVFAVALSVTTVRADEVADRNAILARLQKIRDAFMHKDLDALARELTPDFTAVMPGQQPMSLKQVMAANKADFARWVGTPDIHFNPGKVVIQGSTAIVDDTETFNLTLKDSTGQIGPKGKVHRVKDVTKSRATFVRASSGWLAKKQEVVSEQVFVDGKPYHPPMPAPGKRK
jgi:ketosteroid isomerase-like protein